MRTKLVFTRKLKNSFLIGQAGKKNRLEPPGIAGLKEAVPYSGRGGRGRTKEPYPEPIQVRIFTEWGVEGGVGIQRRSHRQKNATKAISRAVSRLAAASGFGPSRQQSQWGRSQYIISFFPRRLFRRPPAPFGRILQSDHAPSSPDLPGLGRAA